MNGAPTIAFHNHQRVAKKRARAIIYTPGESKKAKLYTNLLTATSNTLAYLKDAQAVTGVTPALEWVLWNAQVTYLYDGIPISN